MFVFPDSEKTDFGFNAQKRVSGPFQMPVGRWQHLFVPKLAMLFPGAVSQSTDKSLNSHARIVAVVVADIRVDAVAVRRARESNATGRINVSLAAS